MFRTRCPQLDQKRGSREVLGGSCGKGGNPLIILNKLISQKFFIKNVLFLRALRKWYSEELEAGMDRVGLGSGQS